VQKNTSLPEDVRPLESEGETVEGDEGDLEGGSDEQSADEQSIMGAVVSLNVDSERNSPKARHTHMIRYQRVSWQLRDYPVGLYQRSHVSHRLFIRLGRHRKGVFLGLYNTRRNQPCTVHQWRPTSPSIQVCAQVDR